MTSPDKQALKDRKTVLLREIAEIDKELSTCRNCEHFLHPDYCTAYASKLDDATMEVGPKQCPKFIEDPIPF